MRGEHSTALVCLGWTIARLPAASSGQPGLAQCPRDKEESFDFCLEGSRVNPQLWLSSPSCVDRGNRGITEQTRFPKSAHSLEMHLTLLENPKALPVCKSQGGFLLQALQKKRENSFPRACVSAGPQLHPAQPHTLQSSQKLCFEAG